ncbi:class I SAM-dependent methyltransferase [Neobacillus niacini]|uniref:class I SAM-dependent methyltransferase n=1 Tax=Neobacillus niacini TaxID=86668 RepID=UPI00203A4943|nr:SAM-dependent methyltransferase [Neobacillus niacini]MCM3692434.1 SAM-dependent methyltransferase [Neobacillus niacini]
MITYLKRLISYSELNLLSYADYIEAVLYHPELGFYMRNKQKIGSQGDFITTSNISDIYGRMIAKWFANVCKENDLEPTFCEIGAGNGRFAHAFLQEWEDSIKSPLKYIIVESSPYHLKLQNELLKPSYTFTQVTRLDELEPFEGMVFSNELFDAMPVHVIEKENNQLYEVMVGIKNENLYEEKVPLTNPSIYTFLKESDLELTEKQRIEVPLLMEGMVHDISRVLKRGLVVTADYGYTKEDWKHPSRIKGSLRGYYQHQMVHDVLERPGEMDITTHIHFDWLIQKGEQADLLFHSKLRQDEFLLNAGILKELENHYDPNPFSVVSKRNRAIRSLIMPSGMSSFFHILIQQKGINGILFQK